MHFAGLDAISSPMPSPRRAEVSAGRTRRDAAGFTLLEVMVALVILGLTVLAYVQLMAQSSRSAAATEAWSVAVTHAEDLMERHKMGEVVPGPSAPQELRGGFERWVETRPRAGGTVHVRAVVVLPDGRRFELDRLAPPERAP